MPENVEIKARVANPEDMKVRVAEISDGPPEKIVQEDIFFRTRSGRLKLRIFSAHSGELISYERRDSRGPKTSTYQIFPTDNPALLERLLTASLGVVGVVRKVRQLYMIDQTRIHLDEVERLGSFIELEVVLSAELTKAAGEGIAKEIMSKLSIRPCDLIDVAYIDLLSRNADV